MKVSKVLKTILLIAMCFAWQSASAQHTVFYGQRASLFEQLPVDSTNIVFFGNSLTNGCEWHELLRNPKVINRGISGDIVQGLEDRLEPLVKGKPAKIFVLIGVNDVSHNLTADSIAQSIDSLLAHIQKATPATKIYLQSCLPINQSFGRYKLLDGKEQVVRDINTNLEAIACRRGITWINLYPSFADDEGNLRKELTNDGLHLLGPAYLIWRDIVLPYVNE